MDGISENDSLGASVSNAGDVNGDGFDDMVIGAPGTDSNGSNPGSIYIECLGKLRVLALRWIYLVWMAAMVCAWMYDGSSVAIDNAGGINGDVFADVIVGAPKADPQGNDSGF